MRSIAEAAASTLDVARLGVWLYTPDRRPIECLDLFEHWEARHSSGQTLRAEDHPRHFAALTGRPQTLAWRHRRLDGTQFDAETTLSSLELQGEPRLLVILRDVTERRQAEEALRRSQLQLRQRNETLQIVNGLADRLHRSRDLATVAQTAVEVLRRYMQAPKVAFFRLDEPSGSLVLVAADGFTDEILRQASRLPLEGSLSGVTVRERRVIVSEDMACDARLEPSVRTALVASGSRSVISVPLTLRCIAPSRSGAGRCSMHASWTCTPRSGSASWASCAPASTRVSSSFTTSPRSICASVWRPASRPWCAGAIRAWG